MLEPIISARDGGEEATLDALGVLVGETGEAQFVDLDVNACDGLPLLVIAIALAYGGRDRSAWVSLRFVGLSLSGRSRRALPLALVALSLLVGFGSFGSLLLFRFLSLGLFSLTLLLACFGFCLELLHLIL